MRIMIITNEFPPDTVAGTAVATDALARKLQERKHEVVVCVVRSRKRMVESAAGPVPVKSFSGRLPKGFGWTVRLLFVLRQARRFDPQLIQGQALSCGLLAAIIGKLLKVPSITYVQGQDLYQAKRWQKPTEIKMACLLPDAVVAVTEDLKRRLQKAYDLPIVHKIPHGFEAESDDSFKHHIIDVHRSSFKGPFVICVGRLEYIKGQDILLRSWPKVIDRYPQAKLWLVGDGSHKAELQQLCCQLGIDFSVTFFGRLAHSQAMASLSAADLLVMPSRSEAFGIILLEAMSKGLPVVAAEVDGTGEIFPQDGDVYPVSKATPELFSHAILQALHDNRKPSKRNQDWAQNYTWDRVTLQFEELYTLVHKQFHAAMFRPAAGNN